MIDWERLYGSYAEGGPQIIGTRLDESRLDVTCLGLLEVAVAGGCGAIVTHNLRDFAGIERFGLRAVPPRGFLREIGETS